MSMEEENLTTSNVTDGVCLKGNPKANFTHTGPCLCGTPVYFKEEKDTSWEARLNKQFFAGVPIDEMGSNQVEESELQGFIRQEREALLREILEKVESLRNHPNCGNDDCDCLGHNKALTEVQELIKKKI